MSRTRPRLAAIILVALVLGRGEAATPVPFARAVTAETIDFDACREILDGKGRPADHAALRRTLGLVRERGPRWNTGQKSRMNQYLLVFKRPLAIGSMILSPPRQGSINGGQVACWTGGADEYLDPEAEGKWHPLAPTETQAGLCHYTLPVGFATRAFLYTDMRRSGWSTIAHWSFFTARLYSLTRRAVGSGEQGPYGAPPDALAQGCVWRNTCTDQRASNEGRYLRGPVSDATPSWYILSWEKEVELCGVLLCGNVARLSLHAYRGEGTLDPAIAAERAWQRLAATQVLDGGGSADRIQFLQFAPRRTRALKLRIELCDQNSPMAEIKALHALTELGEAPPPPEATRIPPFSFSHIMPHAGEAALVLEDGHGRRVRYLLSQARRSAGGHEETWDLKDDAGAWVVPGEYQWHRLSAPPLHLTYQMCPYPNVQDHSPDRVPWLVGVHGPHGWMADHCTALCGIAFDDKVWFGSGCAEGGVSLIQCTTEGKKLWGRHNLAAWTGPNRMCRDKRDIYLEAKGTVYRLDPETRAVKQLFSRKRPNRHGPLTGMAAHGGKLFLTYDMAVPHLVNAAQAGDVDLDHCIPRFPAGAVGGGVPAANPRAEFLRLLRLSGTPPGQRNLPSETEPNRVWPMALESSFEPALQQHILVAFRRPVALGSLVLPHPGHGKGRLTFAVLRPDAPYPPRLHVEADWVPFADAGDTGWVCLAAPAATETRALRIRFSRGTRDELDDLMDGDDGGADEGLLAGGDEKPLLHKHPRWFARLDGLKLLRRRYRDVTPTATVRVNSGAINAQGEWDGKRTAPLTEDAPGIYVLEWQTPQSLRGLAIKEVDAALTRIDVWTGDGPVNLDGKTGWTEVTTYRQRRRDYYKPNFYHNWLAPYLDGYVDFKAVQKTRAVRLRLVRQWTDNGNRGCEGQRHDRGQRTLDTRRCRLWGVAALEYLSGEVPVDPIAYQRIETYDSATGTLQSEVHCPAGRDLLIGEDCAGYSLRKETLQTIDLAAGTATTVASGLGTPLQLTRDGTGTFYIYCGKPDHLIRVLDADGQATGTIGKPGGVQIGPWVPERFGRVADLFVDHANHLWVLENEDLPRRILQYGLDGALQKELTGNPWYGGGGVLHRYDKSICTYGPVRFALDWQTGRTRIAGLMTKDLYNRKWGARNDLVPMRIKGNTYWVSASLTIHSRQSVGVVYLEEEDGIALRLAAAFGAAEAFPRLHTPAVLARMTEGRVPGQYRFCWADRNGNGQVDSPEVELELRRGTAKGFGPFRRDLSRYGDGEVYRVAEFLANGAPLYRHSAIAVPADYRLDNGLLLSLHETTEHAEATPNGTSRGHVEHVARRSDGAATWRYPSEMPGVSGLHVPGYRPGFATNEFGIIGHETTQKGDLGEFFVMHSNSGMWRIWSADGLLAGAVLRHKSERDAGLLGPDTAPMGTKLGRISAGQEHFHGFFTQSEADGKYYLIMGQGVMVMEVTGLDRFVREEGRFTVTGEDLAQAQARARAASEREVRSRALLYNCHKAEKPPTLDGRLGVNEWPVRSRIDDTVGFAMTYDTEFLYLGYTAPGILLNTGEDVARTFKTGAALDFKVAADGDAPARRQTPVAGDQRLLLTWTPKGPRAVLYQPVRPGARPDEAWETRTVAGGTTRFDRVVEVTDQVQLWKCENATTRTFSAEARIPLALLGITPKPGLVLRFDWGVLTTDQGHRVKERLTWANHTATGTSDEAVEARLIPSLWGHVRFHGEETTRSGGAPKLLDDKKESFSEGEALDALEGD